MRRLTVPILSANSALVFLDCWICCLADDVDVCEPVGLLGLEAPRPRSLANLLEILGLELRDRTRKIGYFEG